VGFQRGVGALEGFASSEVELEEVGFGVAGEVDGQGVHGEPAGLGIVCGLGFERLGRGGGRGLVVHQEAVAVRAFDHGGHLGGEDAEAGGFADVATEGFEGRFVSPDGSAGQGPFAAVAFSHQEDTIVVEDGSEGGNSPRGEVVGLCAGSAAVGTGFFDVVETHGVFSIG